MDFKRHLNTSLHQVINIAMEILLDMESLKVVIMTNNDNGQLESKGLLQCIEKLNY